MWGKDAEVTDLLGKTLTKIDVSEGKDEIHFHTTDGKIYKMYHYQDCCESVTIEDINGNLSDLIRSPIVMAEKSSHSGDKEFCDTYTWTFYKFATVKGYVTIRWYGTSNGYYSEEVDFEEVTGGE